MNGADTGIDFFHHITIAPAQTATGEGIAAKQRCMRHGIGHVEKKRLIGTALYEVYGGLGSALREQGLVGGLFDPIYKPVVGRAAKHERRSKMLGLGVSIFGTASGIDRRLLSRVATHTELHQFCKIWFIYPVHVVGIRHANPLVKTMARRQRMRRVA